MEIIAVPRVLREKWADDEVDAVIELINKSNLKLKEDVLLFVEDKFERRLTDEMAKVNQRITDEISKIGQRLTDEISKIGQRLTDEISKINQRLTDEISKVNERITTEISSVNERIAVSHANLIKWMFIFWCGQIAVLVGLFALFK